MNLAQIRDRVSWMVDFNEGQVDQDFRGPSTNANKRIDWSINETYKDEVRKASSFVSEEYFKREHSFTWSSDDTSMDIPEALIGKKILYVRDDTDETIGSTLKLWDSRGSGSGFYVKEGNVSFGWYPAPSSDRSLTVVYVAEARDMTEATDTPHLIPEQYQELVVWGAAIMLRIIGDEDNAPRSWMMKQKDLQGQFWKDVARGNPAGQPPKRIRNNNPDTLEYY